MNINNLNYTKYIYPHLEIDFREYIRIENLFHLTPEDKFKEFILRGLLLLKTMYPNNKSMIYIKVINKINKHNPTSLITNFYLKDIDNNMNGIMLKIYEEIKSDTRYKPELVIGIKYTIDEYMKEYYDNK
jgi:hypothetical protein